MIGDNGYEYHSSLPYSIKSQSQWTPNDWADVYRYEWGINVVPSGGAQKYKGGEIPENARPPVYALYHKIEIPLTKHEEWKRTNAFDDGLMKLTGTIWHRSDLKEKYRYCSIDMDNELAVKEMLEGRSLDEASKKQCIEYHDDNPSKCHWDIYTEINSLLQKKASDTTNDKINPNYNPMKFRP